MSQWTERILKEFPVDISRLWIASDPDDVLLDEQILASLRERGFEVLPFEDSVAFRAEYEERYRSAWDKKEQTPAKALVLHLRETDVNELPWDYLQQARNVSLSLADLFPRLNSGIVRQVDVEHLEKLFDAQAKHASQLLGETATKEFILTHIYYLAPHLIFSVADFWRDLLRLYNRNMVLPVKLSDHIAHVLEDNPLFDSLPIRDLLRSKSIMLRAIQDAWHKYLILLGIKDGTTAHLQQSGYAIEIVVPFEHPDIRVIVESMFLNGTLRPIVAKKVLADMPAWVRIGITPDPDELRQRVLENINCMITSLPAIESSHRDWEQFARRFAEITAQFFLLDSLQAESVRDSFHNLQNATDKRLYEWLIVHYADMPSLPAVKSPVMVHHIPRYLVNRRNSGEKKIALLVFDGMALDQWVYIRECLVKHFQNLAIEEGTCFAWIPTLTAASRQAMFSGLKPREFARSIDTTKQDSAHWSRFWQDNGLRANEILFYKGITCADQLNGIISEFASQPIKAAGIVVNTIDDFVHGAVLGKRGIAAQILDWCETGFIQQLFETLFDSEFEVYLTADHGNVDSVGQGRPNQGVAPEQRGERVRIYKSESLAEGLSNGNPNVFRLNIGALPTDYLPVFSAHRTAFIPEGEKLVAHGGISVEELVVPFVKVRIMR